MVISKIMHVLQRTIHELKYLPKNLSDYGFKASMYIAKDHIFLRPKSKRYIAAIYDWTETFMKPVLNKYKTDYQPLPVMPIKKLDKIPIWVCWFQGEADMPELVKICYQKLKMSIPENKAEIHLITLDNVSEYITINDNTWRKFYHGEISYAFFSDIIRYYLMRDYGGMWIDATIYVSANIPEEWFSSEYYTMRMHKENCLHEACEGKWTNFCFAGKQGNLLFHYVCDALEYFGQNQISVPDYVFLDYILMAGYHNIPKIKKMIDGVPYNNEYVWELKSELSSPFSMDMYHEIANLNVFHKLAHQVEYLKKTEKGCITVYGYMKANCLENEEIHSETKEAIRH